MTVGEKIAIRRKELGLSQRSLAKLSGVSQPTISAIESSTKAPSTVTISLIAKALKVQTSDLLDGEKEAVTDECDSLRKEAIELYDSLPESSRDQALSYLRFLASSGDKK